MPEYIEHLVGYSAAVADDTYTEFEVPTPVGRSSNQIMVIHSWQINFVGDKLNADEDFVRAHICRKSQSAIKMRGEDKDVRGFIGLAEVFTTSGMAVFPENLKETFYPTELIADAKIYVGVRQKSGATMKMGYSIDYTVRRVSKNALLEALVD